MQRETVIYKTTMGGLASKKYQNDLKKRQRQGWNLVSCTESGRDWANRPILTAIYEYGAILQTSGLTISNLPALLQLLNPQERAQFEQEMQAVVNQWLARKTGH